MNVTPIDPRDQTSEVLDPGYRVHFWDGRVSDERELSGADVPEVLAWAEITAAGRTFCLYAAVPATPGPGMELIRLAGWEGPIVAEAIRPSYAVDVP